MILSGEGAGIDRRISAWMNQHREGSDLAALPLYVLERALNLTALAELEALRLALAELPARPALVVVDTFSKFSAGLDENDNSQVSAYLSALSEFIREEFQCTVLLVAHSGHGDAKRPRGASTLMSNPDAEYIVARPDPGGMTVTVSRERFKDAPSMPPLAYEARVIDLGRMDRYGEPVTSLALIAADAPAPSVKLSGKNQEKLAAALQEFARTHPEATHITSIEMRDLFKAQKIPPKRRTEVLTSFVNARVLDPRSGRSRLPSREPLRWSE